MLNDTKDKIKQQLIISRKALSLHRSTLPSLPSVPTTPIVAKADSGASQHYIPLSYKNALLNTKNTAGPTVHLADDSTMQATATGILPLTTELTTNAKSAHIFKELKSPLLSLGQLCDDGCEIKLSSTKLTALKNNNIILQGYRNHHDGLWDVPIPQQQLKLSNTKQYSKQKANIIIRKDKTKMELAQWLHASCGSPQKSTFIKAIKKGNFLSWPGLDANLINKQLPDSEATAKGHLNQERKNLQSTKPTISINPIVKLEATTIESENDTFPSSDSPNLKSHNCFTTLVSFEQTAKAYSDQTGKFPFTSSRGNKYLLIVYDYDSNAILQTTLKNRTAGELTNAWTTLHKKLSKGGSTPSIYILDNEFSNELKSSMDTYNVQFQLVPPHIHRRNAAERAIQTFKHHFLAILASCDPDFPISEWDRLLDQSEVTLNLLRNSRMNPNLSAYAYLFGNFNFNATPLAPPGTKAQVQLKVGQRGSWSFHTENGWYVGRSPNHYRCVNCYIPSTHKTRHADTVKFFPKVIPFPSVTLEDFLRQATSDILAILQNPPSIPSLQCGDKTQEAVIQIAQLLNRSVPIPPLNLPSPPPPVPSPRVVTPQITTQSSTNTSKPAFSKPAFSPRVQNKLPPTPVQQSLRNAILDALQKVKESNANVPFQRPNQRYNLRSRAPHQRTPFRRLALQYVSATKTSIPSLSNNAFHLYHPTTGKKETIDTLLNGPNATLWTKSLSNEWGRLAQGNVHGVKATDTIDFIHKSKVPVDRKVTYGSFVCDYRPLKDDPYRIRLVVGGDKLDYNDDPASPAAGLLETKLLVNSVISDADKGAKFMCMDLKDHFLASPMERPEYMRVHQRHIPLDIITKYQLADLISPDGYIYIKIKKGMYGLKQAAILAYQKLVNNLAPHGYRPCKYSVGLWRHDTLPTKFCLCVDDFGIKYYDKKDANHLLSALRTSGFTVSTDWEGKNYCGLTFDWNYDKGYVDISMPDYVKEALHKFQHEKPSRQCHAPHQWSIPVYGKSVQYAKPPDDSERLTNKKDITRIQSIVGTFLYYARAIESPLLPALNEIGTQQSKPTKSTNNAANTILDFVSTYPNGKIRFHASDMILHIDTDAAYLVMPNAKSRVAGYYYLSSHPTNPPSKVPRNGAVLVECSTIKHVVSSAAEAECSGCFTNAQKAIPIRIALEELGHPQPKTPIKTDNSTAEGFANKSMRQKRSKAWDMRYHWLRDRNAQNQFYIFWDKGSNNLADYFTKHYSPTYHRSTRPYYILKNHLVIRKIQTAIQNVLARVC